MEVSFPGLASERAAHREPAGHAVRLPVGGHGLGYGPETSEIVQVDV